jgi:hypothetical protein
LEVILTYRSVSSGGMEHAPFSFSSATAFIGGAVLTNR